MSNPIVHTLIIPFSDVISDPDFAVYFPHNSSTKFNLSKFRIDSVLRVEVSYHDIGKRVERFHFNPKDGVLHILEHHSEPNRFVVFDYIEIHYISLSVDREVKLNEIGI